MQNRKEARTASKGYVLEMMQRNDNGPREAINKSLCPAPFRALPLATKALAISSFGRSGVLK
jgi:hypothetical protein